MRMSDKSQIFMTLAYVVARQSKDKKTQIGAILVGPDNEVRSTGYNGLPRNCNDAVPERQERPEKYYWFEHAERNAIYNAARIGVSTKGCTLYTMAYPCADCARAIIQAGIVKVVVHKQFQPKMNLKKWTESYKRSLQMLGEALVDVVLWDGAILELRS